MPRRKQSLSPTNRTILGAFWVPTHLCSFFRCWEVPPNCIPSQIFFEEFGVGAVYLANPGALSVLACGAVTGVAVDVGLL